MKKSHAKKSVPEFVQHPDRDRRVRQSERIGRVLRVLGLIQSRARWNTKSISNEIGCSERTVYRDLEVLQFAGVPWFFDEIEKCYRIRADYRFPTLSLTRSEIIGQVVATSFSNVPGLELGTGASLATQKIAESSGEDVQDLIADTSRLITVLDMKLADHSQHRQAIQTIQFALLNGRVLAGVYDSPYESRSSRVRIHPYRLCFIKQAWYLIGRLEKDCSPKTFRVARFKSVRSLQCTAVKDESFDVKNYFGDAWAVYRGDRSYSVELRFERSASRLVTETIWHSTQVCLHHKDGRVTLKFNVDGLNEILPWILSWTGQVKVIAPEALKILAIEALEDGIQLNAQV